jgi:hypothetical protein
MMRPREQHVRPGTWLIRWAERNCSQELREGVVLPIVADLQYEAGQAGRWSLDRVAAYLRHYVGLARAMGYHQLSAPRSPVPKPRPIAGLLWLLVVPVALLASRAAQFAVVRLASIALYHAAGPQDWITGASKCVASVFMGASFVVAAWWMAPTRKPAAAAVAFVVVLLWAGVLIAGALIPGFNGWLLAMGLSGLLGGAAAWRLTRRSEHPVRNDSALM